MKKFHKMLPPTLPNAGSRQNSLCLGSSLSLRSFAIVESNSKIPTLLAALINDSSWEDRTGFGQNTDQYAGGKPSMWCCVRENSFY